MAAAAARAQDEARVQRRARTNSGTCAQRRARTPIRASHHAKQFRPRIAGAEPIDSAPLERAVRPRAYPSAPRLQSGRHTRRAGNALTTINVCDIHGHFSGKHLNCPSARSGRWCAHFKRRPSNDIASLENSRAVSISPRCRGTPGNLWMERTMKSNSYSQPYAHGSVRAPCSMRASASMHIACVMARRLRAGILVPGLSARA